MVQRDNKSYIKALAFPSLLSLAMILIFALQYFHLLGERFFLLFPREPKYLLGVLTSPLEHGDFMHLFGNLFAFLPLSFLLFYFYKKDALYIFVTLWVLTGFLVWIFARPVFHIGASGVVYALQAFILITGFIKRRADMMAIAGLCVILFGTGFYFGMLPVQEGISWESHLMGFVSGTLLAAVFYKKGPKSKARKFIEHEDQYAQFDHKI